MKLYAIYAGLSGEFGYANFIRLDKFNSDDEANCYAEACAREKFDSYDLDMFGLDEDADDDEIDNEADGWIDYYAIKITTEEQLIKLGEDEGIDSDAICHFVTETFHK